MSTENENFLDTDAGEVEVFHWKGQKRYRCPKHWPDSTRCMYDTFSLEAIVEHISKTHVVTTVQEGAIPYTVDSEIKTEFKDVTFKVEDSSEEG